MFYTSTTRNTMGVRTRVTPALQQGMDSDNSQSDSDYFDASGASAPEKGSGIQKFPDSKHTEMHSFYFGLHAFTLWDSFYPTLAVFQGASV